MIRDDLVYKELSFKIVGIAYEVYNEFGFGYLEKHYERAMASCFENQKIDFKRQIPYKLYFKNKYIGIFYFDFLIEGKVIVELKKGNYFSRKNLEQTKSYLMVSGFKLAILINFTSMGVKILRVLNPNNKK
jgi:GxxExxY protein